MPKYIYEHPGWPDFKWNGQAIAVPLGNLRLRQGRLLGCMEAIGFPQQQGAELDALTEEVLKSGEIEGEELNVGQVRSSLAKRLGLDAAGLPAADRKVEGVVEMVLEATRGCSAPITRERIFAWHKGLFPDPRTANIKIIGYWRTETSGTMQVLSGPFGRQQVHYEAPSAKRVEVEMNGFFKWANGSGGIDPLLRAAKAHLWFVTVHPFEDGNGRIARAITDWALARSEDCSRRFYSMSGQIMRERNVYYDILERTQKGSLDITDWMLWFIGCLDRAIAGSEASVESVLAKDRFWKSTDGFPLNERQRQMLNRLLDGELFGKLTSTKWAKMMKCSHDTAQRDIVALIGRGILVKDAAGGRSTNYSLKRTRRS